MSRKAKVLLFTLLTAVIEIYFLVSFIAPLVSNKTLLVIAAIVGFIFINIMNYNIFSAIFEEK